MNILLRRLGSLAALTDAEKAALGNALSTQRRHCVSHLSATQKIHATGMTVVLEGLACRYELLGIGRRQIMGYYIAGDICGLPMASSTRSQHCIATLGHTRTAMLSPEHIFNSPER